jgi:hypothetical protein
LVCGSNNCEQKTGTFDSTDDCCVASTPTDAPTKDASDDDDKTPSDDDVTDAPTDAPTKDGSNDDVTDGPTDAPTKDGSDDDVTDAPTDAPTGAPTEEEKWCTVGGTAPDHTPCVFPFSFGGAVYTECTKANNPESLKWCATETDSNGAYTDQWGDCQLCSGPPEVDDEEPEPLDAKCAKPYSGTLTAARMECVFPFIYLGVEYTDCAMTDGYESAWCYIDTGFNQWGDCQQCNETATAISTDGQQWCASGGTTATNGR